MRGHAYLGSGRVRDADESYRHALGVVNDYPEAQVGIAQLAWRQGDLTGAREQLKNVQKQHPDVAASWSLLGEMALSEGKADEAEKAFSKAIALRHYVNTDVAKRALARAQQGKYDEADEDLRTLKKYGLRKHPYVNYVAGINYFKQRKYRQAEAEFQSAINRVPDFYQATMYLAATNLILGNLEQALQFAQKASSQAPYAVGPQRILAAVYLRQSKLEEADQILQQARARHANDAEILRLSATLSWLEGDPKRAMEYAKQIEDPHSGSPGENYTLMVAKLLNNQQLDNAVDAGATGNASAQQEYVRKLLYAIEAFKARNFELAVTRAKKLHEQFPERIDPLNLLAGCYLATADWSEARKYLNEVLELDSTDPTAVKNLAKPERQQGHLDKAESLLTGYLKKKVQDQDAALLLAKLLTAKGSHKKQLTSFLMR